MFTSVGVHSESMRRIEPNPFRTHFTDPSRPARYEWRGAMERTDGAVATEHQLKAASGIPGVMTSTKETVQHLGEAHHSFRLPRTHCKTESSQQSLIPLHFPDLRETP